MAWPGQLARPRAALLCAAAVLIAHAALLCRPAAAQFLPTLCAEPYAVACYDVLSFSPDGEFIGHTWLTRRPRRATS
jgi:hypothetical protein